MADESAADDRALHDFWRFIELRRAEHRPEFDLEDLAQLALAVDEFDNEAATP
jgi:hypothetical protein